MRSVLAIDTSVSGLTGLARIVNGALIGVGTRTGAIGPAEAGHILADARPSVVVVEFPYLGKDPKAYGDLREIVGMWRGLGQLAGAHVMTPLASQWRSKRSGCAALNDWIRRRGGARPAKRKQWKAAAVEFASDFWCADLSHDEAEAALMALYGWERLEIGGFKDAVARAAMEAA